MPVYELKIKGASKPRIFRSESAAKARDHIVTARALSADELVDLLAHELDALLTDELADELAVLLADGATLEASGSSEIAAEPEMKED